MAADGTLVVVAADVSGSMLGQSASLAQVQIQELFSQLKDAMLRSGKPVYLGIFGFHTRATWLLKPTNVSMIADLPRLEIKPDESGLYPRTSFIPLLTATGKIVEHFQPGPSSTAFKTLEVILITDGYSTDPDSELRTRLYRLRGNRCFDRESCHIYAVMDDLDDDQPAEFQNWFIRGLTGSPQNRVRMSEFALLTGRICGTILDDGPDILF